jgi:DNA polymerase (family 10)
MRNAEVAKFLDEIADLLELKGDSPYRIGAYREAARTIESLPKAIESFSELTSIPGIGESIAQKIGEYLEKGKCKYHEDLKKELPPGLIEIKKIPGVGAKTARLIYEKLKISSIQELERAIKEQKIRKLPRMGAKAEENIMKGIQLLKERSGRLLLGVALPAAQEVVEFLRDDAIMVEAAGSIRRRKETIGDIDILAASDEPRRVMERFVSLPLVKEVLLFGEKKSSILTRDNLQIDLRVISPSSWGAAIQYFTGSKAHNIKLRELAMKRKLKINEYGIFDERNRKLGGEKEEDIYRILGLEYVPPELREDQGEVEAAGSGKLPELVRMEDIMGDLHLHTKWSDGKATPREMAEAALRKGYEYVAICDHSKGLGVASGLTYEEAMKQKDEIAEIKMKNFKILSGIEVNILSNGNLDFSDEELKDFDIVIAGIHSGFRQPKEKITERILSAMENENVDVISHPTGRLIERRAPYEVDVEKILDFASSTKTILEISALPERLDLRDIDARRAKDYGVKIAIGTDAHSIPSLELMKFGVSTARRGWLEKKDIINTLPLEKLLKELK